MINKKETIHLRRRQIFTIFDPYPPTIGIPAKCLWRGFLILMYCDLLTIGIWGHPSPPKTCWRLKWMVPIMKSRDQMSVLLPVVGNFGTTQHFAFSYALIPIPKLDLGFWFPIPKLNFGLTLGQYIVMMHQCAQPLHYLSWLWSRFCFWGRS